MKVLHVIPSLSPKDGGPSFALPLIARGLSEAGIQVDVVTTDGSGSEDPAGQMPGSAGSVIYLHFSRQSQFYKVSWPMTRWLARHIQEYDLVHIHALFSYASGAAAYLAIKHRVPYIVRPLGVLNRWGMENRRRWLKRLSFNLIERRILHNAAAVHYTSRQEQLEAEEAGVEASPAVIPLGIDLSEFEHLPEPEVFYGRFPAAAGRRIVLFLSRLDAKKGLDLLLAAFAEMDRADMPVLVIAGTGDETFLDDLSALAARFKIEEQIIMAGFLTGREKLSAFSAASVFVLPSYSENFGIAVVEALAAGLPCVISDQVGIAPDVAEFDAGMVVPCKVPELAAALQRTICDPQLRSRMGANARRLAGKRFSTRAMTEALVALYQRTANREREFELRNAQCEMK